MRVSVREGERHQKVADVRSDVATGEMSPW
jgi:hypothetical protein